MIPQRSRGTRTPPAPARDALLAHAARCAACGGTDTDRLTRLETAPTTVVAAYVRRRHRRRVWVPVL
ncbi:hypothetical protein GCM10017673_46280 [Streptosporangium violaceochromogenes]|nr:hypothetical protein GCM10017673_46280 [Streptosporangium violaceochromogenes]